MSRQLALELDARRKDIDEELGALMDVLRSHNATLTSPLVDAEGFPRADIDIHAIRIARNRIAHLRNDRVAVTEQMAQAMRDAFLEPPGGGDRRNLVNGHSSTSSTTSSGHASDSRTGAVEELAPFARINSVSASSPAETAGLREGDLILSFGGLSSARSSSDDAGSTPSLSDLPPLVREGQQIEVILRRGSAQEAAASSQILTLQLVPASGPSHRGLLGCHLLPL
ncbi:putative 26S proteasome regulatory subunit [Tilletia horrida]|uniref:26S proteasome regulatory subunit n=1 Tax=Tilletia horrida TaxID=155126 RepID=A0AAN6JTP0_9BASI|nr:putative 26S proteasome regulatory subunit [Tilletia horrida]KAK0569454.1 putative 26S proteasome regulatory subunit [Tilletia horrida]